eukprot:357902-Chlamydomonas_euryale.AAC.1
MVSWVVMCRHERSAATQRHGRPPHQSRPANQPWPACFLLQHACMPSMGLPPSPVRGRPALPLPLRRHVRAAPRLPIAARAVRPRLVQHQPVDVLPRQPVQPPPRPSRQPAVRGGWHQGGHTFPPAPHGLPVPPPGVR